MLLLNLVPGGSFSVGGSYPQRVESPEGGEPTCGATQTFQCSGSVVREGPRGEVLVFQPSGRMLIRAFLRPPR